MTAELHSRFGSCFVVLLLAGFGVVHPLISRDGNGSTQTLDRSSRGSRLVAEGADFGRGVLKSWTLLQGARILKVGLLSARQNPDASTSRLASRKATVFV
jgi:hypothetical protein